VNDPDMVQLLREDGERIENEVFTPLVADVGTGQLQQLYEDLVVLRRLDLEATALQRQGQIGIWAPCLGQEAAQIGSARALETGDFAFPTYREHGVEYVRGVDLTQLLRQWRGAAPSSWKASEIGLATTQIIVGAQGLHAVGYALGLKLDGDDHAAIVYFGDGAASQGDIAEAFTFAAAWQVPVVFFCQNNQYAISEPVQLQSPVPLSNRAAGAGIQGIRVDGNDVLAVLAVTRHALRQARSGGGPTLIEAVTYRMGPHTTSDDPTRYRDGAEVDTWKARDPVDRLRLHLTKLGVLDQARADEAADRMAATVRAGVVDTPDPAPESMFDHVYVDPHPGLEAQRAELNAHLASLTGEEVPR
jgi:2-oxoisovalerate dehydrogenase E1 component subunit alpha